MTHSASDVTSNSLLLGFDIGGTKSAVCLGDGTGRLIARSQTPTTDPAPTMDHLIDAARRLLDGHAGGKPPTAAGVSVGSPLSRARGLIMAPPNLPHWVDVPVAAMIRERLGEMPVNLENDADASALAEYIWGVDRRFDPLIYLTCGTGQGSGIVIHGRLHRGADNLAGEIGHVRLLPLGPVGCRKAGSVEGLTSGTALGKIAQLRLAEPHEGSMLDGTPIERITGRCVGEAAAAGDELAISIVAELGDYLGRACAILIDILNPERISLGSLAVRLGDLLMIPVREAARREALAASFKSCTIAPAALGERVQDLAALAAATVAIAEPGC